MCVLALLVCFVCVSLGGCIVCWLVGCCGWLLLHVFVRCVLLYLLGVFCFVDLFVVLVR